MSTMAREAPDKPTILVIQGSFQIPEVYHKLSQALTAAGYPTIQPPLPTCTDVNDPSFPKRNLADDANAVRSELTRLVEKEDKAVLVVMHSYGGLVGSEAVLESLSHQSRKAHGLAGGVIALFYYSAFILNEGQSVLAAFGESPNNDVTPDGRFSIRNGATALYNDLPAAEAQSWADKLIPQSYAVQTTELTNAAWRYIPSTYLVCEGDQAAPKQFQEMFAAQIQAKVIRCAAGHSAHLSDVEGLVARIEEAVREAVEG